MEWGAALAGLFGILLLVLREYIANQPGRTQEVTDHGNQQGRIDIATGNVDAINDRGDELLSLPAGTKQSDFIIEHDSSDILKRFQRQTGADILPDRTGSTGENTGESRAGQ